MRGAVVVVRQLVGREAEVSADHAAAIDDSSDVVRGATFGPAVSSGRMRAQFHTYDGGVIVL